jgi:hypothetical protein
MSSSKRLRSEEEESEDFEDALLNAVMEGHEEDPISDTTETAVWLKCFHDQIQKRNEKSYIKLSLITNPSELGLSAQVFQSIMNPKESGGTYFIVSCFGDLNFC